MEMLGSCWRLIQQTGTWSSFPTAGCRREAAVADAADAVVVAVVAAEAVSPAAGERKGEGNQWAAASSAEDQQAGRWVAAARVCSQIQVLTSHSRIGFSLQPVSPESLR